MDKAGHYSVLYRFLGGSDGGEPTASVTEDAGGNLYGAAFGNHSISALSTVFELTQAGQLTVLHDFTGIPDGDAADATPILDAAGNLYGTTSSGGFACNSYYLPAGCGVVYKVDASGQYSVIHTFKTVADGVQPQGLAMDAAGNLYGSTALGGASCFLDRILGCGTVYKIDTNGTYTVLHRFETPADGVLPTPVTVDAAGNVYGITVGGGDTNCSPGDGCGTIFRIDAAGRFSVLYTFTPAIVTTPGYNVPVLDSQGNLYDSTAINQPGNGGFLFKLDTNGNFTELFVFPDFQDAPQDGEFVNGTAMDADGNFYGTMLSAGDVSCNPLGGGCGTVFKLTP